MKQKFTWLILLIIPFILGSCNDTDDVQKIFTGRTWRLTYITKKNEHGWFRFPGVDDKVYESYDPINGSRKFTIEFTGNEEDGAIYGSFIGSGSVTSSGTWMANGKSNVFSANVQKSSVIDSKDTLGKYIIEGLKTATSYSGDTSNLFLYFEYNAETLCLVFAPNNP